MSIGILGLKTQTMAGRTANKVPRGLFTAFNPGDTSWTCPATGYYTFTLRGPGGQVSGGTGGGSGAAAQKTALLYTGQVVTFVIGQALRPGGLVGSQVDTVVTLPSGLVVTAGRGIGGSGGAASGGDLNVNGNAQAAGVGGSSPTIGQFVGSPASSPSVDLGPGVGVGGSTNGGTANSAGGPGILFVQYGKPPR